MSRISQLILFCILIHISSAVRLSLRGGVDFPGTSWFNTCDLNRLPADDEDYPILLTFEYNTQVTNPPTTAYEADSVTFKLDIAIAEQLGVATPIAGITANSLEANSVSVTIQGGQYLLSSWVFQKTIPVGNPANAYYIFYVGNLQWSLRKQVHTGTHVVEQIVATGYYFDCDLSNEVNVECLTHCDTNCVVFPATIPPEC